MFPGRIVRQLPSSQGLKLDTGTLSGRVARLELEARQQAEAALRAAERRGLQILDSATRRAAEARLDAEAAGRAQALADFAAQSVLLQARVARAQEASLDATAEIARALAERLIGEALRLEPSTINAMARRVLQEVRGATVITLVCHPDDAEALRDAVDDTPVIDLTSDPQLSRGDLRLVTDVGTIEARIGAQLDVLATALRRSLRP